MNMFKKFGGLTKYELISLLIAFNEYKIVAQLVQTESEGAFSFSFLRVFKKYLTNIHTCFKRKQEKFRDKNSWIL